MAANEELIGQLHNEVVRTNALIMGATGAAIAFAMHQTAGRAPSWSLIPTFVGVGMWAFGFWAGIMNSHAKQAAFKSNHYILLEKAGAARQAEIDFFRREFDKYNRKSRNWYYVQLYALLVGALLYFAGHGWHIMEKAHLNFKSAQQTATVAKVPTIPLKSKELDNSELR